MVNAEVATASVCVVIPTLGRSQLAKALSSVRSQEGVSPEVVVVLDDPSATETVRAMLIDEKLVVTSGRVGAAVARNIGLDGAQADFVAFLDDDDWWEPRKLALQLDAMTAMDGDLSYTNTTFHERSGRTRVLPRLSQPELGAVADWLVSRRRIRHGDGYMQTSSLLVRSRSLGGLRWDESMPKHQDWDYVLRLLELKPKLSWVSSPLVHVQQGSVGSISASRNWRASHYWFQRHKKNLGRRASGDFVATHILRASLATREWAGVRTALGYMVANPPHVAAALIGVLGAAEAGRSVVTKWRGRAR